jgi:hypothetical protein
MATSSKKTTTAAKWPIVEVVWWDAEEHGDVGWNDIKSQLKHAKTSPPLMRTVGYCVHRCESHISLLSTIGTKEASTLEKIPMSFVIQINEIPPPPPPPPTTKKEVPKAR